jgi:DNA-binding response OmpR family regulator
MSGSVLIVDDSLTVRMNLVEAFRAGGFRALASATAQEARDALSRELVELVILDVVLPDADGIELLKEIRARASGPAVLLLSSEAEVKDRIRGLKTGADEYIGKPYDSDYVVAKARAILGARPSFGDQATRILVIDDSPTYRDTLRDALECAGYGVHLAASGEEGLRVAAAERPGAVIVDGVLPGVDGATVIRSLRLDAALRDVPCLLLTASEDRRAELGALDAGADAFVRKEEDVDVVIARLEAILRRAPVNMQRESTASLLEPKKILAVDDSPTFLNELAGALRADGYEVILARSGEEALELLAVQPVDCILLDLIMPGLGGNETCRRIKEAPVVRDVPVIMLTAVEDRDTMIESLGAGADDYIPKSSAFEVLRARVRAQMRRKQFEDENRRFREEILSRELEAAESRTAREIAERRAAFAEELERKNKELEAFSYSVSHDLRAPLRSIASYSEILLEECGAKLDAMGRLHLGRIRAAAQRMGELIDDLLELSRVSRAKLKRERLSLSQLAHAVAQELERGEPARRVTLVIEEGLFLDADGRLVRVILENLFGNAWKFTSKTARPKIELGTVERDGALAYFVRDNGAGFDMTHAERLFKPFQRLHGETEFPGTGIGLATVARIVERHGGRVWAEAAPGGGATIFFTLAPPRAARRKSA